MAIKDQGPMAVGIFWSLTFVLFIVTGLRCYTRIVLVRSFGIDDHVYVVSFLSFFFYCVFIHVSATYGFGQNITDIHDPGDIMRAMFYEGIGQTFSIFGQAITKWSLGLFLIRLVITPWHRILLWMAMIAVMISSLLSIFVFYLQCSPPSALWDRTIKGYKCGLLPTLPFYFALRGTCVFTDLFYALFPWLFIWKLQMNQREKIVILSSMSLGVIAAAFGIKCTFEIPNLESSNPTKVSVPIILWAAAEQAVTMICIGIPVCRPLYKQYISRYGSNDSRYEQPSDPASFSLRTIGGSDLRSDSRAPRDTLHGLASPGHLRSHSSAIGHFPRNSSDEDILVKGGGKNSDEENQHATGGIYVTQEIEITRAKNGN